MHDESYGNGIAVDISSPNLIVAVKAVNISLKNGNANKIKKIILLLAMLKLFIIHELVIRFSLVKAS